VEQIDARQQLETLRRDEKTQGRALASVNEKVSHLDGRKQKLDEEKNSLVEKRQEVSCVYLVASSMSDLA
jgi:predicted  nucleic acid-binding Zn-ribbon protein